MCSHQCGSAEADRERAYKAAQAQYEEKQRAAAEARKASAKRSREAQSVGPCVCEVEALQETVQAQREIIRVIEKVNGPLMRWLKTAAAAPAGIE